MIDAIFVTPRAMNQGAARGTHPAMCALTGQELRSAIVRCTHRDLADPEFREWLWADVASRFPSGADSVIKLEIGAM